MSQSADQTYVWPTLRARDALALIDFLEAAFGFRRIAVFAEGAVVHHAQLAWPPGGGLMLGSARGGPDDAWPLQPGTFGAYLVTDDPAALCERARAAGATILAEVAESGHGLEFRCHDPEGNLWSFGTYLGEPRPS